MSLTHRIRTNRLLQVALVAAVILIGIRAMLPHWVTKYVNRELNNMGEYHGEIADVDLQLIVGSYSIKHLIVTKHESSLPVPFLVAPEIELAIDWGALLRGKVVAKADFYEPQWMFVDNDEGEVQGGFGVNWRRELEKLAPFQLDEVRFHDGIVHFYNFTSDPPVELRASEFNGTVLNLSNRADESIRPASYTLSALLSDSSNLQSQGNFDPLVPLGDFDFQLKIDSIQLVKLNKFFQAYLNLDVASGDGSFVMELEASQGQLLGYAKPLFTDVDIFQWQQDVVEQKDNPLRVLWEMVAGGAQTLFKNQSEDQFATRIEIRGETGDPEASTWQVIKAILVNAFVEAYRPVYESLPEKGREESPGR